MNLNLHPQTSGTANNINYKQQHAQAHCSASCPSHRLCSISERDRADAYAEALQVSWQHASCAAGVAWAAQRARHSVFTVHGCRLLQAGVGGCMKHATHLANTILEALSGNPVR
jgi:hypothetical protein